MKSIDSDSKGVAEDFLERGARPVPSLGLGRVGESNRASDFGNRLTPRGGSRSGERPNIGILFAASETVSFLPCFWAAVVC